MSNKLYGIRLDPELWKRVKVRAAELGVAANGVVAASLERWLDDPPVMGKATHPAWQARETSPEERARGYAALAQTLKDVAASNQRHQTDADRARSQATFGGPRYEKDEYSQ